MWACGPSLVVVARDIILYLVYEIFIIYEILYEKKMKKQKRDREKGE